MLKTLFNEYKWIALGILLLAYSIGVWNVSSKVHDTEVARDRLRAAEHIIELKEDNDKKVRELEGRLGQRLETLRKEATAMNKGLMDELAKDKRYTECTISDGVQQLYDSKLEAQ